MMVESSGQSRSNQCTYEDLVSASRTSRKMMEQYGASLEQLEAIDVSLLSLHEVFNGQALSYCLSRYIDAELDCISQGVRGLGRVSKHVPRLGAHYRKQISKLSTAERSELFTLIQTMMLQGYEAHAALEVLADSSIAKTTVVDGNELFEVWIPLIYSFDFDSAAEFIGNFTFSGWERIRDFFELHRMKAGNNKTKEILAYYMFAGFALRMVETGKSR